ncbi:hypothetical protein ABM428_00105 [Sulfitobacter sp. TCYB15]|uniref:DUF4276 family protein n=1 Tax=Sulfitobacter sp. TCYB15 TaxID=3229275 RepID=A0AAU8C3F6_9RHOB
MNVFYCIEDVLSRAVAQRLILECCPAGTSSQELGKVYGGFGYIKKNLSKFHNLAQRSPVLIITDLDNAECPPSLRKNWLDSAKIREPLPDNMLFCIARTEIESWLLADTVGIGSFLKVSAARLRPDIEMTVLNAKEYLVELAKASSNAGIRNDLTPSARSDAATGVNYNYSLSNFVSTSWRPHDAAENSVSLNRAITKLSLLMP